MPQAKQAKKLRTGFTTGTCAAAASQAACEMLFGGGAPLIAAVHTPKGEVAYMEVISHSKGPGWAKCAVVKDGGDDPDATSGLLIFAKAEEAESGIRIAGGEGIGKATLPGLSIKAGEDAINPVPRAMIEAEVTKALDKYGKKGALITISAPGGEEAAKRTFNSRLGIIGGISILGTTGVVEPMSEPALIETIRLEASVRKAAGREYLIGAPGSYGTAFAEMKIGISADETVKYSNFAGEIIDFAESFEMKGLLLIGHFGKMVKLAGGIMNTHSRYADCRMQIIAAEAGLCGGGQLAIKKIMASNTVEEAIMWLEKNDLRELVLKGLMEKISFHINRRAYGALPVEAFCFTNMHGLIGETQGAKAMLALCKQEIQNQGGRIL